MLRQIMRSKVLLSMVVEWILGDLKDLPGVRDLPANTKQQNVAIERAILHDWKDVGLAKPIRRPAKDERRDFTKSMSDSFDELMKTILIADEKEREKAIKGNLTKEFQELARELLEDNQKIESIRMVTNFEDNEKYTAFKGAMEVVFMDLISPKLYKP